MNLSDDQLSKFAAGIARLIQDLEKGEDEPTDIAASSDQQSSTAEIQAAREAENLRCKLTGYEAANGAVGVNPELQREIMSIKASLRERNQPDEPLEIVPSGWNLESNNPELELSCRRHELDALTKAGDLQRQVICIDRIRQLEMTIARG